MKRLQYIVEFYNLEYLLVMSLRLFVYTILDELN